MEGHYYNLGTKLPTFHFLHHPPLPLKFLLDKLSKQCLAEFKYVPISQLSYNNTGYNKLPAFNDLHNLVYIPHILRQKCQLP